MTNTKIQRITTILLVILMLITALPINIFADDSSGKGGSSNSGGSGGVHNWIVDTSQGGYRLTLYHADSKKALLNGESRRIGKPVIYVPSGGKLSYIDNADVKTTGKSVYDYMNEPKGIAENPKVEDLGGSFKEYKTISKGRDKFVVANLTTHENKGKSEYIIGKLPTFDNAGNWSDELINGIFGKPNNYKGLIELSKDAGSPLTLEQIKQGIKEDGKESDTGSLIEGKEGFGGKIGDNKSTEKGIYKVYIESVVGVETNKVINRPSTEASQTYKDFDKGKYLILSLRDLIWLNMHLHDNYGDVKYNTIPAKAAIALQRTMNAIRLTKDQPEIQMYKNDSDTVAITKDDTYKAAVKKLIQPDDHSFKSQGVGIFETEPPKDQPSQKDGLYDNGKKEKVKDK